MSLDISNMKTTIPEPESFASPDISNMRKAFTVTQTWTNISSQFDDKISSESIQTYDDTNYSVIVRICLLGGLVVMSIIGNTLAAHKLLKKKARKTRTTILFLHLTFADILVTVFPMAGQMTWESLDLVWYANSEFCKLFKFLQTFALVSSNYMLVAIAVDRHQAITRPLATPLSSYWLVGIAWVCSLVPSLPNTATFSAIFSKTDGKLVGKCEANFENWQEDWRKVYFSGVGLCVFVIPLFLFICLYSHVLYKLRSASIKFNMETFQRETQQVMSSPRGSQRVPNRNLLSRARIKTTNLSLSVIVAFIVTNLPYIIDEFIRQDIFTGGKCNQYPWCHVVKAVIGIAPVSNSAINPFIYLLFNAKSPSAQNCTNSCCPLTRTVYKSLNMIRVKFRQPTTTSGSARDHLPLPIIRERELHQENHIKTNLHPLKEGLYHCTSGEINVKSPFLVGCDCRGEESHNHNCPHCDFCHCQYGVSFSVDGRGNQSDFEISLS